MAAKKKKKKKGSRYHRGVHVSLKMPGREFKYRSGWEEAYFRHLDSDPTVISYDYECLKIPYVSNLRTKKIRHYMPDFVVVKDGETTIIEIKPTRFLKKLQIVKKLNAGQQYAQQNGLKFQVITEVDLKSMALI